MMNVVWIIAVIVFGIVEGMTEGLVSVWFAVGSLAGLLASALNYGSLTQLTAFVVVSAIALAATRPLAQKYGSGTYTRTNADRVIGQIGRVTEDVDGENGVVYADGKSWTARSADGTPLPADTQVRIDRIEGVKLYVSKV
jgi:membrane protein implicated in regulation of membrane protease activity